jgi:hypothetical protein
MVERADIAALQELHRSNRTPSAPRFIKDALAATINNVTRTAALLGVTRERIHDYKNNDRELQEHRAQMPHFV